MATSVTIPINSINKDTPVYEFDGVLQFGLWVSNPAFRSGSRVVRIEKRHVGCLDLLSHEFYGEPTYWWVIADANDIIDQFTLKPGDELRIPDKSVIDQYVARGSV